MENKLSQQPWAVTCLLLKTERSPLNHSGTLYGEFLSETSHSSLWAEKDISNVVGNVAISSCFVKPFDGLGEVLIIAAQVESPIPKLWPAMGHSMA